MGAWLDQRFSRPIIAAVEGSWVLAAPPSSSPSTRMARVLPSSTPHWSKLLIPQMHALDEGLVLVEGQQGAEGLRAQPVEDHGGRGAVAGEGLLRGEDGDLLGARALGLQLGLDLRLALADQQGLGLGDGVGQQLRRACPPGPRRSGRRR